MVSILVALANMAGRLTSPKAQRLSCTASKHGNSAKVNEKPGSPPPHRTPVLRQNFPKPLSRSQSPSCRAQRGCVP